MESYCLLMSIKCLEGEWVNLVWLSVPNVEKFPFILKILKN